MPRSAMNDPRLSMNIGDLVTQSPSRAVVFERYQLDYCCGGRVPLGEACEQRGLDAKAILTDLNRADGDTSTKHVDWSKASATALADHIEQTHHAWLREELPRLHAIVEKVAKVHGENQPHLHEVAAVYQQLAENLLQHQTKEEQVLFPAIRAIEVGQRPTSIQSLDGPLSIMTSEHEEAGEALRRLRDLTNDYVAPFGACTTYCVMLDSLRRLERDTHVHVHKEESILFPKARRMLQVA